ncbi:unnamed protein product [Amoebophrya sp. A120]|nr:unnamed protein product [Amoebophrya sp. A120]|eukprot:GSA120T00011524001.1
MPERTGQEERPHQEVVHFLGKTQDAKIISNDMCRSQVLRMLQGGVATVLQKSSGASENGTLSQDPRSELFFACSKHLFDNTAAESSASSANGVGEAASSSSSRERDAPPTLETLSEEKKIQIASFPVRSGGQGDDNFGLSKVFGLSSELEGLNHAELVKLNPHLLGLCRMRTSRHPFSYSSCYSIGGPFLQKSKRPLASRICLHKQMLAMDSDFERVFSGFVDSILEDIEYLREKESEFLFLGFVFTPLVHSQTSTRHAAGGASASDSGKNHAADALEFRWKKPDKFITVDYVKAHKRSFCAQMLGHYYAQLYTTGAGGSLLPAMSGKAGSGMLMDKNNNAGRKVVTFHFLTKQGKEVIECSTSFHLFVQNTETKTWSAYYTYPRWQPVLDGAVLLSPKFAAGLAKAVSFKTKQKESSGGFFGGSTKKEDPDEKNRSAEEVQLLRMISYQLPEPCLEVEKYLTERLKSLASDFELVPFFTELKCLESLKICFRSTSNKGSSSSKSAGDGNRTALAKDCARVLENPLLCLVHRARSSLHLLLSIGKRNHFASHVWALFRRQFRSLLQDVQEGITPDLNLFFLYPALHRYLVYFEDQDSIFSVSVESLRTVSNLLRVSEWSLLLLLAQGFSVDSLAKIDEYMGQTLEDSFTLAGLAAAQNSDSGGGTTSGQQASQQSAKPYSFRALLAQLNPYIPSNSSEAYAAPAAVARNFPPSVSAACQLFFFLTKAKVDAVVSSALRPLTCARPTPEHRSWRAAFLRSYLIELVRPVLLQHVLSNAARTKFLKDFTFTGINEAYARRGHAKQAKKREGKSPRAAESVKSSVNFCGPSLFRGSYPDGTSTPRVHQRVEVSGALGNIFAITPAFFGTGSSVSRKVFVRQEDIHFHHLYVEKSNLEFLFHHARRLSDTLLSPSEAAGGSFFVAGRGNTASPRSSATHSAAGGGTPEPRSPAPSAAVPGSPRAAALAALPSCKMHASLGPVALAGAFAQGSGVFPNLVALEAYCEPDARADPYEAFAAEVAKIVRLMFEKDEHFLPNCVVSQPGNKIFPLHTGEFSKDMLDRSTESVWIDGVYFLEPSTSLPRGLLEAKRKLARSSFSEARAQSWSQKPRYVRLLVQVTRRLSNSSPRYFLANTHPGLFVAEETAAADAEPHPLLSPEGINRANNFDGLFGGDLLADDGSPADFVKNLNAGRAKSRGAFNFDDDTDPHLPVTGPSSPEPMVQLPGALGSPLAFRTSVAESTSPPAFPQQFTFQNGGSAASNSSAVRGVDGRTSSASAHSGSASNGAPVHVRDVDVKTAEPGRHEARQRSGSSSPFAAKRGRNFGEAGPDKTPDPEPDPFEPDFSRLLFCDAVTLDARRDVASDNRDIASTLLGEDEVDATEAAVAGASRSPARRPVVTSAKAALAMRSRPPAPLAKNVLFGLTAWSFEGFDAITELARCLHPLPNGFFLQQVSNGRRLKWKTRTLNAHELRAVARRKLEKLTRYQDRVVGLFDSWVYTLKYCLLELDTIITISDSSGVNFAALQEMWTQWVVTLRDDVLHSRLFVLPLFPEVQRACLGRTVEQLDAFAIPTYDEDQLRDWLRLARNCLSVLECFCVLAQGVWLHATGSPEELKAVRQPLLPHA